MSTSDDFPFIPPWRLASATVRRLRRHLYVGLGWGRYLLLGAELPHTFSCGWSLWVYLGPVHVVIEWRPTDREAPGMTTATAEQLLAHADAISHSAAVGGYLDERTGARRTLSEAERAQWAADAAVLREAAYQMTEDLDDGR